MKEFFTTEKQLRLNIKKTVFLIMVLLIVLIVGIIILVYVLNENFREWADTKILFKEIEQGKTVSIEIQGENIQATAFDQYIVVLQEKTLKFYNNLGVNVGNISVDINNAMFKTAGKYLVVAEKNGNKVYVITGKTIYWETETDGEITQIEVNDSGYIGIVTSDISYKNIVYLFSNNGSQLLKTYLANTKVISISISKNNQYLAIAEIDMSGVIIQSNIKIVSVEKAKSNPQDSIITTFKADVGKLIVNIQYQNKDRLICMYNDTIDMLEEGKSTTLVDLQQNKITYSSIELNNALTYIEEKPTGEHTSNSYVWILNPAHKTTKKYVAEKVAKEIYSYENVIGLNFGGELYVINKNGWLIKKYIANQEINSVIMSNKIVGIVYRDKIEIMDI
ncbi:MAG: hypothetical protein IJV31_03485 [Clostridia bacterium]|nr:hypothetical protein [Clostridia bacterium]